MFNIHTVIAGLKSGHAYMRSFTAEEGEGYETLTPILGSENSACSHVSGTNVHADGYGGSAEVSYHTILERFEPTGWIRIER